MFFVARLRPSFVVQLLSAPAVFPVKLTTVVQRRILFPIKKFAFILAAVRISGGMTFFMLKW